VFGWPLPPFATDLAFGVVFGVFVAALAVLGFVAIRWGVRKDRPGRAEWRRRYLEASSGEQANGSAPVGFGNEIGSPPADRDEP
jgi:hypothetical protein